MNLFEHSAFHKWRFASAKGVLNTEDLCTLKLEELDKIAKTLNKELKDSGEESFITKRTVTNSTLEGKLELVKYIISVKLEEKDKKVLAAQRAEKRSQLIALIGKKEITALEGKSIEELKQDLAELD